MHTKYTCTHHTHWGRERKTEWGKRQRDTIGHLMCKWPTVRAPRNGLAFYFIWFCDFWFWLCLLLLATCLYVYVCVVYCQLSVSVSIERKKAKRTAHAGCWWSNAQCCCLIKSRMREYYFALPQSWRRCFCCCCCCLRYGAAAIAATVDVVSCLCVWVSATHAHSSSRSYVLPFLSLPASYTALSAHQYMHTHLHARIHCIYFLPSSHSRGSFVIKLAGTTSQLTATKSWHSGAHKLTFPSRKCNSGIIVEYW